MKHEKDFSPAPFALFSEYTDKSGLHRFRIGNFRTKKAAWDDAAKEATRDTSIGGLMAPLPKRTFRVFEATWKEVTR